jgi:hypothetical protein
MCDFDVGTLFFFNKLQNPLSTLYSIGIRQGIRPLNLNLQQFNKLCS